MSAAAIFEERVDPARFSSAFLAVLVHVLLFSLLVFGVRWQSRPPESVVVELWNEPVPVREEPKPVPKVEPAPPPKPEPVIEKPDIAVKAPPPPKPKPVVKPEPPKPKVDEAAQKRLREELAREQTRVVMERERTQMSEQLARDRAAASRAASQQGLASWMDKIRIQIRSRIRIEVAQAVPGNPEAVFDVTLLPSGEVLNFQKRKSSGHPAYDDEVERALSYFKNSPLPKPDRPELFSRDLRLTFRPKDL